MGVPYMTQNNQFLLKDMRVYDNQICYPEKYTSEVGKLFTSRYNLHHDCYNHKTIHAYELMVCDVLFECHNVLYDFVKVVYDPEQYLKLDDSIIDEIVHSEDPRLKKAQEIIERMQYR
jgi:deoxynucleoside triphosphate triphosphohydrolase SAMHD1